MAVPFHPFWLIALLVFVGMPAAALSLVAWAIVANARPGQTAPPAYGLRSPDGRWWWDGRRRQPAPPPAGDS